MEGFFKRNGWLIAGILVSAAVILYGLSLSRQKVETSAPEQAEPEAVPAETSVLPEADQDTEMPAEESAAPVADVDSETVTPEIQPEAAAVSESAEAPVVSKEGATSEEVEAADGTLSAEDDSQVEEQTSEQQAIEGQTDETISGQSEPENSVEPEEKADSSAVSESGPAVETSAAEEVAPTIDGASDEPVSETDEGATELMPVDEDAPDLDEPMPGTEESPSGADDTGSATSEAAETAKAATEEAETPPILEEAKDAVAAVQSNTESSQTADDGPTFDLVRVENDGSALIAGTAAPNSEVTILAEGVEIGKTTASSSGEFVAMVQTPPSDVGQSLQIAARSGATLTLSKETIIVLPVLKTVENAPEAPAIIKSTPDEIIIIQPTSVAYPDQVTLDLISYDDAGELQLAGRGTPDHDVRVYVDNRPAGRTTISSSGSWRVTLSGLQAGRYVLRLDELDGERVSSRFETPFQRAFPEEVREVMERGGGNYTVQPGNTLWYIATQYYGQGLRYHQIFGANQDKIRDPDLIYPGQVFDIPQMEIAE